MSKPKTNQEMYLTALMNEFYHEKYLVWFTIGGLVGISILLGLNYICYGSDHKNPIIWTAFFMSGGYVAGVMVNLYLISKFSNLSKLIRYCDVFSGAKFENPTSEVYIKELCRLEKIQQYTFKFEKLLLQAQHTAIIISGLYSDEQIYDWEKTYLKKEIN